MVQTGTKWFTVVQSGTKWHKVVQSGKSVVSWYKLQAGDEEGKVRLNLGSKRKTRKRRMMRRAFV